jgi:NTE family protein
MGTVRNWLEDAVRRLRHFAYGRPAEERVTRRRVGLALGGGFARGIAHIGVLKVLEANRVPIDFIAGTSVGALIAASYACGAPLAALEEQAAATRFKDFGKWTLSWLGLASNERLENYLQRFCAVNTFEELKTPLAIAATDLGTGEAVYFSSGELGPPLRASCAYPGLFLPVEHDGRILVDGFLAAAVPVEAVRKLGAELVIAVYLESGGNERPKTMAEIISRSFSIMQRHAQQHWRKGVDVLIEPAVKPYAWDDFARTPELIAAGEAAARAALPRILGALAPRKAIQN